MCEPGTIRPDRRDTNGAYPGGNGHGEHVSGDRNGHQVTHAHADLTVEILGVAMFIPTTKNAILVDGARPRPAVTKKDFFIPPHYSFIAFPPGTYQAPREFKAGLRFDYDLGGDGQDESYDAFVLRGHRVIFENVDTSKGQGLEIDSLAKMTTLAGAIELKPGVEDGTAKEVAACVELGNATFIRGESHGIHNAHAVDFNGKELDCSEKVVAEFRHGTNTPRIRLKNAVENIEINLVGSGPWVVMIANIPVEEVMDSNMIVRGPRVPLTHCELIYDLYDINDPATQVRVPTCRFHDVVTQTADGHCGPPYQPGP